jgi:hypothetical protein
VSWLASLSVVYNINGVTGSSGHVCGGFGGGFGLVSGFVGGISVCSGGYGGGSGIGFGFIGGDFVGQGLLQRCHG